MTSTEPSCGQNFCQKSLGHHVRCSLQSSSLRASVNGKKMKNSLLLELTETVKQSPQLSCQISKETMMLLQGFHELLKQLAINTGQLIHGTKHTHKSLAKRTGRLSLLVGDLQVRHLHCQSPCFRALVAQPWLKMWMLADTFEGLIKMTN